MKQPHCTPAQRIHAAVLAASSLTLAGASLPCLLTRQETQEAPALMSQTAGGKGSPAAGLKTAPTQPLSNPSLTRPGAAAAAVCPLPLRRCCQHLPRLWQRCGGWGLHAAPGLQCRLRAPNPRSLRSGHPHPLRHPTGRGEQCLQASIKAVQRQVRHQYNCSIATELQCLHMLHSSAAHAA